MHKVVYCTSLLYRNSMNEHSTPEAPQESQNNILRKFGEGALYIATRASLVAGLAAGALWAMRQADIAPLSVFGDAIDFGPKLDLDQGDSVMDVK